MPASASLPAQTPDAETAREIATILRTVADPTRLRIYLLLRQGETCVCELASSLNLAENLVSHHLGVLRRAALVQDRRDAADPRWVYYQLNRATLQKLAQELGSLFDPQTIGTRIPTCGPAALLMPRRAEAYPAIKPPTS